MANYKYETNKCDGGEGMNWCVIRHELNESGGSIGTVVRYAHTRDIARAYVSAAKVADAIPGATIRTTMTEGKTTFRVWPTAVHIEAPALVQPSYYISKSIGQADIVEIRGPFEVSVASFSSYESAVQAFNRIGNPGHLGGPSLPVAEVTHKVVLGGFEQLSAGLDKMTQRAQEAAHRIAGVPKAYRPRFRRLTALSSGTLRRPRFGWGGPNAIDAIGSGLPELVGYRLDALEELKGSGAVYVRPITTLFS